MYGPVAIADCNNFYASCEKAFDPSLRDRPVVVLSNNDGMIIARSAEAKALGIPMAEPLFKIKPILEKYNAKVCSSNYALYGDMSHRVMTTLESFTPDVEIYSIDEAFLHFEGFSRLDLEDYCREIRRSVGSWIGLPISIGLARTKTLAKIANRWAKKEPKHDGVLNLLEDRDLAEYYLKKTEVEDIWGVGRQYTKMLNRSRIFNAYELTKANDKWVRQRMTVMGLRTVWELRGIPCIELEYSPPPKKAIVVSRSFGTPAVDKRDVKQAAALFITRAAEKLRSQKSGARSMTIFLRTNPFKENEPQYHNGALVEFPLPTDYTGEMLSYAEKCVDQIFRTGYKYKKVGVMLTDIAPYDRAQTALFDPENRDRAAKVTELLDKLNTLMGSGTISFASAGAGRRDRFMRRDMLSPRYTTKWSEIPKVKAK